MHSKTHLVVTVIAAIIGLEMFVVLGMMHVGRAPMMGGDARDYHNLALNLLRSRVYSRDPLPSPQPTMYRSPGYPLFLATVYVVAGPSVMAVRIVQFCLLGGTAFLIYLLGRRLVSERAAELAAILCAAYPPFIIFACTHYPEILASFAAVLALLLLHKCLIETESGGWIGFAAGVVLGSCILIRAFLALFVAGVLLFVLVRLIWEQPWRRHGSRATFAIVLGAALVTVPWIVRNVRLARRFVPLGVTAGVNLWEGAQQFRGTLRYPPWTPPTGTPSSVL